MEESLTLAELQLTLEAARKQEARRQKFAAALKGVDLENELPDDSQGETIADRKRKIEAELQGKTEESVALEEIGIAIIEE